MASQTVTKYFRDSVAAKLKINFKNSRFMISDLNSLIQGKIDSKYYAVLSDHKNVSGKLDVIVVAKTIKTKFDVQQRVETNIEDMTGILYIPGSFDCQWYVVAFRRQISMDSERASSSNH